MPTFREKYGVTEMPLHTPEEYFTNTMLGAGTGAAIGSGYGLIVAGPTGGLSVPIGALAGSGIGGLAGLGGTFITDVSPRIWNGVLNLADNLGLNNVFPTNYKPEVIDEDSKYGLPVRVYPAPNRGIIAEAYKPMPAWINELTDANRWITLANKNSETGYRPFDQNTLDRASITSFPAQKSRGIYRNLNDELNELEDDVADYDEEISVETLEQKIQRLEKENAELRASQASPQPEPEDKKPEDNKKKSRREKQIEKIENYIENGGKKPYFGWSFEHPIMYAKNYPLRTIGRVALGAATLGGATYPGREYVWPLLKSIFIGPNETEADKIQKNMQNKIDSLDMAGKVLEAENRYNAKKDSMENLKEIPIQSQETDKIENDSIEVSGW